MSSYATLSVRLPADLRREVDEVATATGRSRSAFIREAVEIYLEEKKAYHAAIDEALKEAEEGIFVSWEKVKEWLESWGTENELPPPEPDIFPDRKS